MNIVTYISFNGRCEEAFNFYIGILGGKIGETHHFRGTPMEAQMPPAMLDKIMHASATIGDTVVFGTDGAADPSNPPVPNGFSLTLAPPSIAESERVFAALSAGGKIIMPLEKTFWATRFGALVDQFGVSWMINCDAQA
jgi:PhnB protein